MPVKRFLNSNEAAQILGVNVSTIKRWTDSGKLECLQTPGGHRKFLMKHLNAFLKNQPGHAGKVAMAVGEGKAIHRTNFLIQAGEFEELQQVLKDAALASDRDEVRLILNGLVLAQYPVHEVFDHVVTPVLHSVGELWIRGELSIAEEHVASQLIRDSIVELQDLVRINGKSTLPAFCLSFEDDQHDIAIKMVQVVLESAGIPVINSGFRTPVEGLELAIRRYKPGKMYISTTFIDDPKDKRAKLKTVLEVCERQNLKVYIGGQGLGTLDPEDMGGYKQLKTFKDVYNS
ncbi:MAG: helix-turn-helix domain-containing protein [FCB group bacterium]|nr:helix-turn-helix domain-containing protein [FCB group bacterium]